MVELKRQLSINSNNYLSVLEIINSKNHKARLVGGVVRDAILGIESQDVDIITTMLPEELIKVFRAFGLSCTFGFYRLSPDPLHF